MLEKKITVVKSTSGSDRELCMKSTVVVFAVVFARTNNKRHLLCEYRVKIQ